MPGYELELTIGYPRRPPGQPIDYWSWAILDRIRRVLMRLDFHDDGMCCGGGFGDDLYVAYRDRFAGSDDRSHPTFGGSEGDLRRIPIPQSVYGICRIAADLGSALVTFVDDDRLASGSTQRGVRALACALPAQLEDDESLAGHERLGGRGAGWMPVRSRPSSSERWLPGRDILMITDEGDAFPNPGLSSGWLRCRVVNDERCS